MEEIKYQKIVEAINAVMKDVGSLVADAKNTHDNYNYISADKVLAKAGTSMAENGLVVIPGVASQSVEQIPRQGKGPIYLANLQMQMRIAVGDAEILTPWAGAGADYRVPDKAVYKAMTSGHKYFLMKLFCIGIGNEDSEHDPAPKKAYVPKNSKKQEGVPAEYVNAATAEGTFLRDMDTSSLAEYINKLEIYKKGDEVTDTQRVIAENKQAAAKHYIEQNK